MTLEEVRNEIDEIDTNIYGDNSKLDFDWN